MKENPTVVLGLYTGPYTTSMFCPNVLGMALDLTDHNLLNKFPFIWEESCRVDANRNRIIYHFLNDTDADFLFILDEDMLHHPQTPRLLMRHDLPIITGVYFHRSDDGTYPPQVYTKIGETADTRIGYGKHVNNIYVPMVLELHKFYSELGNIPATNAPLIICDQKGKPLDTGVIPIDAAGFGCVLIRRDAVESMEAPYLMDELGLNGDLAFYKQAKAKNIGVYCDMSIIASHPHKEPIGIGRFAEFTHKIVVEAAEAKRENPSWL